MAAREMQLVVAGAGYGVAWLMARAVGRAIVAENDVQVLVGVVPGSQSLRVPRVEAGPEVEIRLRRRW